MRQLKPNKAEPASYRQPPSDMRLANATACHISFAAMNNIVMQRNALHSPMSISCTGKLFLANVAMLTCQTSLTIHKPADKLN